MTERDPITSSVIGAAIEVHRVLGPGLLESVYQHCMYHELRVRGISFEKEVILPISYKGVSIDAD